MAKLSYNPNLVDHGIPILGEYFFGFVVEQISFQIANIAAAHF